MVTQEHGSKSCCNCAPPDEERTAAALAGRAQREAHGATLPVGSLVRPRQIKQHPRYIFTLPHPSFLAQSSGDLIYHLEP